MNTMNRPISKNALIGTLAVLSLALTACGDKEAPSNTASKPAATQTAKPAAPKPAAKKEAMTPEKAGKRVYLRCQACHLIDDTGRHLIGPNLKGIFGRTAGTVEGFEYSDAMKNAGVVWTEETIDEYMQKPMTYIKGNKMVFVGLPKEKDRQNLIAYLKAEAGSQ